MSICDHIAKELEFGTLCVCVCVYCVRRSMSKLDDKMPEPVLLSPRGSHDQIQVVLAGSFTC